VELGGGGGGGVGDDDDDRFEVFMATIMKTAVFWDLNLCSLVEVSGSIVAS